MRLRLTTGLFLTAWLALLPSLSVVGLWTARISQHFRAGTQEMTEVRWNLTWGSCPRPGDDVSINGSMMDVVDVYVESEETVVILQEDVFESVFSRLFDGQLPSVPENPYLQGDWLDNWLPAELIRLHSAIPPEKAQVVFFDSPFRTDHCEVILQPPERG